MCLQPALRAILVGLPLTQATSASAQDPNAARNLAATCFACHGTNGVSVDNVPPNVWADSLV